MMIDLKDVTVKYDRRYTRYALEHINLSMKNEKVVVIGPNGSGKTTLLKVLTGLVHIESGEAYVNGMDVRTIRGETGVSTNMAEVYRIMGSTIRDLIRIYSDLKGGDSAGPEDIVYKFGLETILDKKIHQISSGEQKMIGNIMSLSFNPSLILMDEPFDNVDQARRLKLLDMVEKTDAEMIINTHEFDLLNRLQGWGLYFIIEGKVFGKFQVSQLKNLYISRGELSQSLAVMDTSFGKFSITENSGTVPITSARNLNSLFDEVA
jgi:ABC-type multidrug transport system ATPase subunit